MVGGRGMHGKWTIWMSEKDGYQIEEIDGRDGLTGSISRGRSG